MSLVLPHELRDDFCEDPRDPDYLINVRTGRRLRRARGGSDWPFVPNDSVDIYQNADQTVAHSTVTMLFANTARHDSNSMAVFSKTLTGALAKTSGSATVAGAGTKFLSELTQGDFITIPGTANEQRLVTAIASDTSLTVASTFANTAAGQAATRDTARVVCKTAGVHLVTAAVEYGANSSGYRQTEIMGSVAGLFSGTVATLISPEQQALANGDGTTMTPSLRIKLAVGDEIGIRAWQSSGGNLAVKNVNPRSSNFGMTWVAAG